MEQDFYPEFNDKKIDFEMISAKSINVQSSPGFAMKTPDRTLKGQQTKDSFAHLDLLQKKTDMLDDSASVDDLI